MLPSGFRSTVTQRFVIWFGMLGAAAAMICVTEYLYHERTQGSVHSLSSAAMASQKLMSAGMTGMAALSKLENAAQKMLHDPVAGAHDIRIALSQHSPDLLAAQRDLPRDLQGDLGVAARGAIRETGEVLAALKSIQAQQGQQQDWRLLFDRLNEIELRLLNALSSVHTAFAAHHAEIQAIASENNSTYRRHMLVSVLFAILVLSQICFFERLWLVTPVKRFTQALTSPSERDKNYLERHSRRQDEIGILGEALVGYQAETRRRQELNEQERERLAQEIDAQQSQQVATVQFRDRIASILSTLESHAARMQTQSERLAGAAADAERETLVATSSTSETSKSIEAVSASVTELSKTIGDIHRQSMRATEIVSQANNSIRDADLKSNDLVDRTQSIEKVIELIQSVAERTNLLSLNATIEAARAGEVGRGFAVVASEIKTLAIQTSRATGDIRSQLQSVIDASDSIAALIRIVVDSISEIDEVARRIAAATQSQNLATREIDGIAVRTAQTARRLDQSIGGVAGMVSDASKTAQVVQNISDDLNRQAAVLRQSVDQFVQSPQPAAA